MGCFAIEQSSALYMYAYYARMAARRNKVNSTLLTPDTSIPGNTPGPELGSYPDFSNGCRDVRSSHYGKGSSWMQAMFDRRLQK